MPSGNDKVFERDVEPKSDIGSRSRRNLRVVFSYSEKTIDELMVNTEKAALGSKAWATDELKALADHLGLTKSSNEVNGNRLEMREISKNLYSLYYDVVNSIEYCPETGENKERNEDRNNTIRSLYRQMKDDQGDIIKLDTSFKDIIDGEFSEAKGEIRTRNDKIIEDLINLMEKTRKNIDELTGERGKSIKRYRIISAYYSNRLTPYILPSQRYEYTPPEGYVIFQSTKDAQCGPTVTRTILATKNPYYKDNDTGKEVAKAFPSLDEVKGSVDQREIPSVLKALGHEVDYMFYQQPTDADVLYNLVSYLSEPFVLSVQRGDIDGHTYFGCETTKRDIEWNGKKYPTWGVGLGDSLDGDAYWIPIDDIIINDTEVIGVTTPD